MAVRGIQHTAKVKQVYTEF